MRETHVNKRNEYESGVLGRTAAKWWSLNDDRENSMMMKLCDAQNVSRRRDDVNVKETMSDWMSKFMEKNFTEQFCLHEDQFSCSLILN